MIDTDLKELADEPPDHPLERLEAQIWVGVTQREQALRIRRRLVVLQCIVLAAALIGGLIAGHYGHSTQYGGSLDVFSPRTPLSASALLTGDTP